MATASKIHGIHLVAMSDARRMDYNAVHQLLTAVATQSVKEQRTALIAKSIAESSHLVGTPIAIQVRTSASVPTIAVGHPRPKLTARMASIMIVMVSQIATTANVKIILAAVAQRNRIAKMTASAAKISAS